MEFNLNVHNIFKDMVKLIELYQLRKISTIDSYLKKIDELEIRKIGSKHTQIYDQVIAEIEKMLLEKKKQIQEQIKS